MPKKLICFDLDNTLILSDKAHAEAYNHSLRIMGYKKWDYSKLVVLFGRPKFEIAKLLTNGESVDEICRLLKLHHSYLIKKSYKYARKVDGVEEVLKKVREKYTIVVLSNTRHNDINYLLKGSKLSSRYFKVIIGSDDVKHSKPYPDEILKVERLLKHKPEYMVGDSIYDLIAAKNAKVKSIGVLTGHYSRKMLIEHNPVAVLKSVKELPGFLGV